MPLILHLSDLHLVKPSDSTRIGDNKAKLVPAGDQFTIDRMFHLTLEKLRERLLQEQRVLDAIVVSGDVANQNSEDGYAAFLNALEELRDVAPPPTRIVVVPGNHDVRSGLLPGDPARYEPFERIMRGAGFVTPVLDGVDDRTAASVVPHVATVDGLEIVAINSSEYAQVQLDLGIAETQWKAIETALKSAGGTEDSVRALRRLRSADAARVSEKQLETVRKLLATTASLSPFPRPGLGQPLRIAVLHHQLLPVSTVEEVKPFESFTNLGLLRQFLRQNGIAVVLHGHKHTAFTYLDYVSSYDSSTDTPTPIRVIAGPALPSSTTGAPVCHLIDIRPSAGTLSIERVLGASPGRDLSRETPILASFVRPGAARLERTSHALVVDGASIQSVYAQVNAALMESPETHHVLCHIAEPPTEREISALYPGFDAPLPDDGDEEVDEQDKLQLFQELVEWWQYIVPPSDPRDQPGFTHGSRIFRYNGYLDQIDGIVEALCEDPDTSKGVVVLLNPSADQSQGSPGFPCFCLVQFRVRTQEESSHPPRLDCVAYFRKQEMRYWWLVNVAELAQLQRRLSESLIAKTRCEDSIAGIVPGSITTFAARAHAGSTPPKVQVPRVDRYFTFNREKLSAMVSALVWSDMPQRETYGAEWTRILLELEPPLERPDAGGVAVAHVGLDFLVGEIERHIVDSAYENDKDLLELKRVLKEIARENRLYSEYQQSQRATPPRYAEWRTNVTDLARKAHELTSARIMASAKT